MKAAPQWYPVINSEVEGNFPAEAKRLLHCAQRCFLLRNCRLFFL